MGQRIPNPTRCPYCKSTATRSREMVYKTGTSHSSGRSRTSGVSFSLTGKARPQIWIGGGRSTSKRQNIMAQEAEQSTLPIWPSFIIAFIYPPIGIILAVVWVVIAVMSNDDEEYKTQWICSKCGTYFIPKGLGELNNDAKKNPTIINTYNPSKQKEIPITTLPEGKPMSTKDYTKYAFNNETLGKGRLVWAIVKKHIISNPNISYEELKKIFPDSLQSNSKTQFSETQVVFSKEDEIMEKELKRFFNKENEIIKIKDCSILISNQWNIGNIQNFINASGKLGYTIEIA